MQKFKVGDKVMWNNNPIDRGTVVTVRGELVTITWVKCGSTYPYEEFDKITKFEDKSSELFEQQAVELLLSLGYTLSKK